MTNWLEGTIFVIVFSILIITPCIGLLMIGNKMLNDMGNFPSKAADIQMGIIWKVILIDAVTFIFLAAFLKVVTSI